MVLGALGGKFEEAWEDFDGSCFRGSGGYGSGSGGGVAVGFGAALRGVGVDVWVGRGERVREDGVPDYGGCVCDWGAGGCAGGVGGWVGRCYVEEDLFCVPGEEVGEVCVLETLLANVQIAAGAGRPRAWLEEGGVGD